MGALAASADSVPKADLLLLAAKEAKAFPEGAAGSSAQHAHHACQYLYGCHCLYGIRCNGIVRAMLQASLRSTHITHVNVCT